MVFESLREFLNERVPDGANWFLLSVRASRAVSTEVATRFGIRHESPQALVLSGGKVVWHGSHYRATPTAIVAALEKLAVG
jgi:bacillithiol system protein YtxJ